MGKIHIENGIISSSADYGLYRDTSQIVNIQDGEFRILGDLIAENYIVSSSVTSLTLSSLSGSTKFGDSSGDIHRFTGSIFVNSDANAITGTSVDVSNLQFKIANPQNDNDEAVGLGFAVTSIAESISKFKSCLAIAFA